MSVLIFHISVFYKIFSLGWDRIRILYKESVANCASPIVSWKIEKITNTFKFKEAANIIPIILLH